MGQNAAGCVILEFRQAITGSDARQGSRWRFGLLKGKWVVRLGVAALAAGMCVMGAAAHGQVQSPPPGVSVPAPHPLSGVQYNYPWEIYGGVAYSHFDAGPHLLQGANIGGFDARAMREFTQHWGVGVNVRGYYGTSGVQPNCGACTGTGNYTTPVEGPFVSEQMFMGGVEYRLLYNKHAAMLLHGFVGPTYGDFQRAIGNLNPEYLGLFSNQWATGAALGGSLDLNRSPKLVFRIAPDATLTNFGGNGFAEQFAISVGLVYRMGHPFKIHAKKK